MCRSSLDEITPFTGTTAVGWIKAQGVAGAVPILAAVCLFTGLLI